MPPPPPQHKTAAFLKWRELEQSKIENLIEKLQRDVQHGKSDLMVKPRSLVRFVHSWFVAHETSTCLI